MKRAVVLGIALSLAAGTAACAAATSDGPYRSPVPQHEIEARAEASAMRAGAKGANDLGARALPKPMQRAMTSYKMTLKNAAARDREMEGLIRRYLGLTREVFQHFRANRPHPKGGPDSYDPMPTWRYQAQQSFEYRLLAARAAVVYQHLNDLAAQQHIDLNATGKMSTRAERVALYTRIFDCIRRDAMARADHGRDYLKQGSRPPPRIAPAARATLYHSELSMMRRSVKCTTLTAQRRPNRIGMR